MLQAPWRHPTRRVLGGVRAVAQGLLAVALVALAALVFLPSAYAAAPITLEHPADAPAVGLTTTVNGTPVPGADLYAALLDIFVGDRPVDAKRKAGMPGAAG